jgi:chromosome segregation ATPase
MKIIHLYAENLKKLRVVQIAPKDNLVQVTGKNGSGKTSVLDSILFALGGKDAIQERPIRQGEDKARIRLDLGDIIVERKFSAAGGTTLTVENAEGARFPSPQAMLDKLIGELSFDPLAFSHMKSREQYEELKRVAKIELDIEKIENQNKADFDKRRDLNRREKELASAAAAIAIQYPDMTGPVDTVALVRKVEDAGKHNANLQAEAVRRKSVYDKNGVAMARVEELEGLLAEAKDRAAKLQAEIEGFKPLPDIIDVTDLREEIRGAEAKNADFRKRAEKQKLVEQAEATAKQSDEITRQIESRNAEKARAIESAAMPVPGLSLEDGRVLLNGIPFDQCSSAEQLRTSVAIAMAANPKLRVIRIKDGSLLDDDGLRVIQELAATQDYQVWIERVDSSGKIGIVMEDGAVRVDNDAVNEAAA